jgi:hypothetical protein
MVEILKHARDEEGVPDARKPLGKVQRSDLDRPCARGSRTDIGT